MKKPPADSVLSPILVYLMSGRDSRLPARPQEPDAPLSPPAAEPHAAAIIADAPAIGPNWMLLRIQELQAENAALRQTNAQLVEALGGRGKAASAPELPALHHSNATPGTAGSAAAGVSLEEQSGYEAALPRLSALMRTRDDTPAAAVPVSLGTASAVADAAMAPVLAHLSPGSAALGASADLRAAGAPASAAAASSAAAAAFVAAPRNGGAPESQFSDISVVNGYSQHSFVSSSSPYGLLGVAASRRPPQSGPASGNTTGSSSSTGSGNTSGSGASAASSLDASSSRMNAAVGSRGLAAAAVSAGNVSAGGALGPAAAAAAAAASVATGAVAAAGSDSSSGRSSTSRSSASSQSQGNDSSASGHAAAPPAAKRPRLSAPAAAAAAAGSSSTACLIAAVVTHAVCSPQHSRPVAAAPGLSATAAAAALPIDSAAAGPAAPPDLGAENSALLTGHPEGGAAPTTTSASSSSSSSSSSHSSHLSEV